MRYVIILLLFFFLTGCVSSPKISEKKLKNPQYQDVVLPDGQKVKGTDVHYYNIGNDILKSVVIHPDEKVRVVFPDNNSGEVDYISYYNNGVVKDAFIKSGSDSGIRIHTKRLVDNPKEVSYYQNGVLKKVTSSSDGFSLVLPDGQNSTIYAISYYDDSKIEAIFPLSDQKTVMPNGERLLSSEVRFNKKGNIERAWLYKDEMVTMPNGEKIKGEVVFYNDNGSIKKIVTPTTEIKLPDNQTVTISLVEFNNDKIDHILLANKSKIKTPDGIEIKGSSLVDYYENGKIRTILLDGITPISIGVQDNLLQIKYYLEYDKNGLLVNAN